MTKKLKEPKPPKPEKEPSSWQIGFAIHQMKNDAAFRAIIIAREGHTLVEFDAAGQEFRWMAIASGDQTMLQLCMPGEDPHSFMGSRIDTSWEYRNLIRLNAAEDKPAKLVRKSGKVGNLSLQYRTSAPTFYVRARVDYDMHITMKEAQHIHFIYPRTYPGVPIYWAKQIALVKQLGYVETFAGSRVQVVGDWTGRYKWAMGSTAINYRIQGTGADQKYLALSVLSDYCNDVGARFILDMHDGLMFEVPDDKVSEFCATGKRLLDNLPYEKAWGFSPPIPMPFDCKIGKSWGTLKGV